GHDFLLIICPGAYLSHRSIAYSANTYKRTHQKLSRPAARARERAAAVGVRHGFPSLRLQATRHNSARAASSAFTTCRGALRRLREAGGPGQWSRVHRALGINPGT